MISGNENLLYIAEAYPQLISEFEKQGLGNYFKSENLNKIGKFIKLNTVLSSHKINPVLFIESLNKQLENQTDQNVLVETDLGSLDFSAMLPCGLRNPFKEYCESYFASYPTLFSELKMLIEGNVNHELSYYPLLDSIEDVDELPDVIMASDINNFFHKPFVERFIEKGAFEAYQPYHLNPYLEKVEYSDPLGYYTMFTANMLVMVVDKKQLGDRKMPERWSDLLAPEFENSIIMRGEDDFFCNAVLLPFYKDHGMEAIGKLAKNIRKGMHPAEMVKAANKKDGGEAAVYIMPWFFSKRLKNDEVEVVWPTDGAIASPVFLLVKKGKAEEKDALLNFLMSKETGELLRDRFFPSTHPDCNNNHLHDEVKWLGWDFLRNHDVGKLKEDIRENFMQVWNKK
ncbi:ABC transporter substrate-binding protein [Carboxylicivirga linearis]|uniref:ABC transporter substrate-binding protein n=1 Tax=Carboxylicivirga linearis TaxID=1628157 RepID=A0ABS5JUX0_9BACT|nr:ABC transporter substrate-binding protein [Carboxylicivirga linearis]MBS2098644.1 ABC transporter substrate-binding protein [Carboxylicivirga linearis]